MNGEALRAAANAATYGPWVADAHGRLTFVDPSFLSLLGRDQGEVLGDGWASCLVPEAQNVDFVAWQKAIEGGQPFERHHAYLTTDGQHHTVWLRANPIRDTEGAITGWAGLHLLAPPPASRPSPSESAVERFLESTTEGFVAVDRDFRFTYVNRVASELTQRSSDSLLGVSHWEAFPALVGTRVETEYRRALAENEAVHFEYFVEDRDIWLEIHAYPTVDGLAIYFRNISARRKAESRLTTALRGARAGVWEWDVITDRLTWSPEMYELLGLEPTVSPSRETFFGLLVPEDQARLYSAAVEAFDRTSEMSVELRLANGGGWLAMTSRVVRDSAGKALRMVGLGQDITERKRTEESLRTIQSSLTLAMKGGRMGYWTRQLDPDVVTWSPELELLFGLAPGSFAGDESQFLKFVLNEDVHLVVDAVTNAILTGEDYSVEFRFRRLDGAVRWMEGRGRAIYDSQGKPTWLHGIGMDITERKEGEAKYRRLADHVPCIVWTTGTDGVTHFVNPRWEEVTGRPGEEMTREDWHYVIHPQDQTRIRQIWQNAREQGVVYETEVRYRTLSGEYRWFLERAVPVVSEDSSIAEWFGTSVDIHDLRMAEEGTRQLLDSMPQLAWSVGADGKLEFINRRYLDYTGFADGFNIERNWSEIVHPDDRKLAREGYSAAVKSGIAWEGEIRLRRADGTHRWHLSRLVPIRGEDGRIQRWFGASADIHNQKLRQNLLDFLVRLGEACRPLDEPGEIIEATVSMLGHHLKANRVAYVEVEPNEDHVMVEFDYLDGVSSIRGRHRLLSFGERCLRDIREGRTFASNDVTKDFELEADLESYRQVQVAALIGVPVQKGGRLLAGLAVHQTTPRVWTADEIRLVEMVAERCWADIARARSDADLRSLNADLERRVEQRTEALVDANREMEGFTYTVSHDLRAPLRAIMSTSMILLEEAGGKLADEERRLLERQASNAKHLGVLIDELLKRSRLSRQEMKQLPFNLSSLAQDVAAELTADGRAGSVIFEIEDGLWAVGDVKLMTFVVLNLLENAAKFSPDGGTVRVGRLGDAFFVSDEGIGFDPRYVDKLFRPFERLVTQSEFPGTGIGLANVQRIVERHNGRVWAESRPGEGSTFWFELGPPDQDS